MKKILCVLLSFILIFAMTVPAFAAVNMFETKSQIPVVVISGDGNTIYDKDEKPLSKLSGFFGNNGGASGDTDEAVKKLLGSAMHMYKEYLLEGIFKDNWEPFYAAIQEEVSKAFGDILLDENGEASNGTHISQWHRDQVEYSMNNDRKGDKGFYDRGDYFFWYDWRLDPMEIAKDFNEFIKAIKRVTGSEKVSIICRCLGTNVVCAYLEQFGSDDIYGVGFDGSVCMGAEPISEALSGKFKVDVVAIERILRDGNAFGTFDIDPFVISCIDLAQKSGIIDAYVGYKKATLYAKLVEGVTSALALSSISYPCYWACVKPSDFDTAVKYVFGKEGSEKYVKYAGLIEKITNYNEKVKKHIPELIKGLPEKGVKVGVISKYGTQMIPTCQSANNIADTFVSVTSSSFGATTGTIYEPLSDEYIAAQQEKGLGKYISPDKNIDASTCLLPDYTWFIKGVRHSEWTYAEDMLLMTVVTSDRQLTIDDFDESQFMVKHPTDWWAMTAMTEENCNTENWEVDEKLDHPTTLPGKLLAFLTSFFNWFRELVRILRNKINSGE